MRTEAAANVSPLQHLEVELDLKSKDVENREHPVMAVKAFFIRFWNSGGKYLPAVSSVVVAYVLLLVLASQQAASAKSASRSAIYTTPNIDNTGRLIPSCCRLSIYNNFYYVGIKLPQGGLFIVPSLLTAMAEFGIL